MFSAVIVHAPARLDVMGGISDYSGGYCLQWPLTVTTSCAIAPHSQPEIVVSSRQADENGWRNPVVLSLEHLQILDGSGLRTQLSGDARWAVYVLGAFTILRQQAGFVPTTGAHLQIESQVPAGAGVSSSAALEVATLTALNRFYGLGLSGHRLATLAQQVENRVVGAPCGVMDQLAVSLGQANRLLKLRCQPDLVLGTLEPPEGVTFYGLDSGVKHSVGGAAYGRARCASFMGRKLVLDSMPNALNGPDGQAYLANLGADAWRAIRGQIPETLTGDEFIKTHGSHGDAVTSIEPERVYKVRLASEHPIYEAERVQRFEALLTLAGQNPPARHELLCAAGDLMIQNHFSYDHRCALGSPETDLLVELARQAGPAQGIYGAKITGGGAGGTVALLVDLNKNPDALTVVASIRRTYTERTGLDTTLFQGSSDGANA